MAHFGTRWLATCQMLRLSRMHKQLAMAPYSELVDNWLENNLVMHNYDNAF